MLIASLGFGIFGMGCDITGITISKIITKWFTGYELASAMGTQLAIARLATAASLSFAPLLAQIGGIRILTVIGAAILLVGFLLFVIYCLADKSYDKNCRHTVIREGQPTAGNSLRQKRTSGRTVRQPMAPVRTPSRSTISSPCYAIPASG